ncbi:MAG TPA: hypothetical protein VGS06_10825 [Streptosporangiaceae bacterium]|nr:hypothetical protein [Streptosporangiaceae bacterium]
MAGRQITRGRYAALAGMAGHVLTAGCGTPRPATAAASAAPAGTLLVGALRPVAGTLTYLGTVAGTEALIGITVHGTRARAYMCDGVLGRAVTLADWFTGAVRSGTLDAVSGEHRVRLAARLGGLTATGTITLADGRAYEFTAPLAPPGGRAGVFERTGQMLGLPFSAGRIVLPGGGQRGAAEYPTTPVRGHSITYLPLAPI